jgi:RNA polymerase sigma-32 factor
MIKTNERESINKYVAQINKIPLLSKEDEQAIAREYVQTKSAALKHKLVTANLRFVVQTAHKFHGPAFTDLIQAGNEGLMVAVDKYNPENGNSFLAYAVWWIRAYMFKLVVNNHSIVRFGKTKVEKQLFYKLKRDSAKMEQNGEQDIMEKLAVKYNVSVQDLEKLKGRIVICDASLDSPSGVDSSDTLMDYLSDSNNTENEFGEAEEAHEIQWLLSQANLSERELALVKDRIMSDDDTTLQEIGTRFGVSRERARQIEEKALSKLKKTFRAYAY